MKRLLAAVAAIFGIVATAAIAVPISSPPGTGGLGGGGGVQRMDWATADALCQAGNAQVLAQYVGIPDSTASDVCGPPDADPEAAVCYCESPGVWKVGGIAFQGPPGPPGADGTASVRVNGSAPLPDANLSDSARIALTETNGTVTWDILAGSLTSTHLGPNSVGSEELAAGDVRDELEQQLRLPNLQGVLSASQLPLSLQAGTTLNGATIQTGPDLQGITGIKVGATTHQGPVITLSGSNGITISGSSNTVTISGKNADDVEFEAISGTVTDPVFKDLGSDILWSRPSGNDVVATIKNGAVSAAELDGLGVESELESVLDLQDLQGVLLDSQIPASIARDSELIPDDQTASEVPYAGSQALDWPTTGIPNNVNSALDNLAARTTWDCGAGNFTQGIDRNGNAICGADTGGGGSGDNLGNHIATQALQLAELGATPSQVASGGLLYTTSGSFHPIWLERSPGSSTAEELAYVSDIHDPVSLSGESYLSLTGQVLTAAKINLGSHVTGLLAAANGGLGADASSWTGLLRFTSGSAGTVTTLSALNTAISANIADGPHASASSLEGAGLQAVSGKIATASTEAGFLFDGGTGSLTCGSGQQGKLQVMDDGTLQYCDGATVSVARSLNPSSFQAASSELSALAALSTIGLAVRTGANAWVTRQISGSGPISVSNGSGVAGNPTISFTGTEGHVVQDETTPLPQRPNLRFAGGWVTCSDVSADNVTACTINSKTAFDIGYSATDSNDWPTNQTPTQVKAALDHLAARTTWDCGSGNFTRGVDASGNPICAADTGGGTTGDNLGDHIATQAIQLAQLAGNPAQPASGGLLFTRDSSLHPMWLERSGGSSNAEELAYVSQLHAPVTLAGEGYLSISGQQITAAKVDLASEVTGLLPAANGGIGANASAWSGLVRFTSGTASTVSTLADLNSALGSSLADGPHTTAADLDGAGLKVSGSMLATDSSEAGFLSDGGVTSLTCGAGTAGKVQVLDDGSLEYCDGSSSLRSLNPSSYQAADADLSQLAGMTTAGFAVRTGADTWATRSISGSGAISVTNGDGASGNPIISFTGTEGHVIQDDGTALTQTGVLDFSGAWVSCAHDSANGKTVCSVPSRPAAEIAYSPAASSDWPPSSAPTEVKGALDHLAARTTWDCGAGNFTRGLGSDGNPICGADTGGGTTGDNLGNHIATQAIQLAQLSGAPAQVSSGGLLYTLSASTRPQWLERTGGSSTSQELAYVSDLHDPVSLAGEGYLSITGQVLTASKIALGSQVAGTLPLANGGLGADASSWSGLLQFASGSTSLVASLSALNTALGTSIADGPHTTSSDLAGAGLAPSGASLATASQEPGFLADGGTTGLTCTAGDAGRVQVLDDGTLEYCDGSSALRSLNPSSYQAADADLSALAGLTSTGIAVRTADGSWSTRSLQAGTSISISNASGVGGDPTISFTGTEGHIVEDEGNPLAQTGVLDFTGAWISCSHDSGNSQTVCSVPSRSAAEIDYSPAASSDWPASSAPTKVNGALDHLAARTTWDCGVGNVTQGLDADGNPVCAPDADTASSKHPATSTLDAIAVYADTAGTLRDSRCTYSELGTGTVGGSIDCGPNDAASGRIVLYEDADADPSEVLPLDALTIIGPSQVPDGGVSCTLEADGTPMDGCISLGTDIDSSEIVDGTISAADIGAAQVSLSSHVSGQLPLANGGLGADASGWSGILRFTGGGTSLITTLSELNTAISATLADGPHTSAADLDGTGISSAGGVLNTASTEAGFLFNGGSSALTCGTGTAGKVQVRSDGSLEYCDGQATPSLRSLDPGKQHDPLTLSGASYLSLAGQVLTASAIDLGSHVTGTLGAGNGGLGADASSWTGLVNFSSGSASTVSTLSQLNSALNANLADGPHTAASDLDGAGLQVSGTELATASQEAGFLADGGVTSMTCGVSGQGKVQVLDDGSIEYCDGQSVLRSLNPSSYQGADADLDSIAALGTTGIAVRSAADTWVTRSIDGTGAISVTNGDGVTGNPTIAFTGVEGHSIEEETTALAQRSVLRFTGGWITCSDDSVNGRTVCTVDQKSAADITYAGVAADWPTSGNPSDVKAALDTLASRTIWSCSSGNFARAVDRDGNVTCDPIPAADNLGNHIATQAIQLAQLGADPAQVASGGLLYTTDASTRPVWLERSGGLSQAQELAYVSDLHDAVTLSGQSYLSIVGQVITANKIDLANHVQGTLALSNGGLGGDASAWDGLIRISGGSATTVSNLSGLNAALSTTIADGPHTTSVDLAGPGLKDASGQLATASSESGFLADGGVTSLSCGAGSSGKIQVMDDGSLEYCDGASTSSLRIIPASVQQADSDLDAVAALAATGIVARTSNGQWAVRSLVAGTGVSITNPSGVSGDPSIATVPASATQAGHVSTASQTFAGAKTFKDAVVLGDDTTAGCIVLSRPGSDWLECSAGDDALVCNNDTNASRDCDGQ